MKLRGRCIPNRFVVAVKPAGPVKPPSFAPLRLNLRLPPSANDYWEIGWVRKMPRLVLTAEAKRYKHGVRMLFASALPLLSGPVLVQALVHRRVGNRSDVPNYEKVLLDALEAVAYENDRQVKDLRIREGEEVTGQPYVEVYVAPAGPPLPARSRKRHRRASSRT